MWLYTQSRKDQTFWKDSTGSLFSLRDSKVLELSATGCRKGQSSIKGKQRTVSRDVLLGEQSY